MTAFQKKVLIAAMQVKKGQVRSYAWIANKIGSPESARAVGNALAKNPYAPDVPCHRVISSNGKLGGYSGPGGLKKKIELLKNENVRIKITKIC